MTATPYSNRWEIAAEVGDTSRGRTEWESVDHRIYANPLIMRVEVSQSIHGCCGSLDRCGIVLGHCELSRLAR